MKLGDSAASADSNPAERAAQAIIALINSRPRSPRTEEIVAIIDKVDFSGARTRTCPHCEALDREYGSIIHHP